MGAQRAVLGLEAIIIIGTERIEVPLEQPVEPGALGVPGAIDPDGICRRDGAWRASERRPRQRLFAGFRTRI
jgi:hypothetical protein